MDGVRKAEKDVHDQHAINQDLAAKNTRVQAILDIRLSSTLAAKEAALASTVHLCTRHFLCSNFSFATCVQPSLSDPLALESQAR